MVCFRYFCGLLSLCNVSMRLNKRGIHLLVLLLLIGVVWVVRSFPVLGEGYAVHVYPRLSLVLTSLSSLFPFSVGDIFIFLSLAGVVMYPIAGRLRGIRWKEILFRVVVYLCWVYVWFYFAWGLNYFRKEFYDRTGITRVAYSEEAFRSFLDEYVENLNGSFVPINRADQGRVAQEARDGYKEIHRQFGLCEPKAWQRAKTMMFSGLFSKVGVSGYVGPFFCEFNLNADLPVSQYAFTYSHELAHLLGVASEAEANLYAHLVCVNSEDVRMRFAGYFGLFPHVMRNAFALLGEEEYNALLGRVNPEVVQLYQENRSYWASMYSPLIGEAQDVLYDWFLKGNKISSGKANYSEVIGLLVALHSADSFILR